MLTAGTVHGPFCTSGLSTVAGNSWRSDWTPLNNPWVFGASMVIPVDVTTVVALVDGVGGQGPRIADGQRYVAGLGGPGGGGQRIAGGRPEDSGKCGRDRGRRLVVATIRAVGARVKLPVPAATLTGRGTIAAAVLCGATSADAAGARTVCAVTAASAVITAMPAESTARRGRPRAALRGRTDQGVGLMNVPISSRFSCGEAG